MEYSTARLSTIPGFIDVLSSDRSIRHLNAARIDYVKVPDSIASTPLPDVEIWIGDNVWSVPVENIQEVDALMGSLLTLCLPCDSGHSHG